MSRIVLSLISLALAMTLAGCDSAKTASKGNFAKVIQKSLFDGKCALLGIPYPFDGRFPVAFAGDTHASYLADNRKQFDALAAAGLLEARDGATAIKLPGGGTKKIPARLYSLTPTGSDLFKTDEPDMFSGSRKGFCISTYKVDEVLNFTEPRDPGAMGMTASQAAFAFSPARISEWTQNEDVRAAFPEIEQKLAPQQRASTVLVLTSHGWREQHDLR